MRLLLSLLAAIGVALMLFAVMIMLVMPPKMEPEPEQELVRVDFVRSIRDAANDERARQPRQLPDRPEPLQAPPEVSTAAQSLPAAPPVELALEIPELPSKISLTPAPSLQNMAVAAMPPPTPKPKPTPAPKLAPAPAPSAAEPAASASPAPAASSMPTIDEDVVPLVDIPPVYPQRAQAAGIEGKVVLRFTITAQGQVDNLRVVEAEPEGVFDREARRAASRWRFAPRRENGQAVPREATKTLYFRLQGRGR